jgi:TolA-binding protein
MKKFDEAAKAGAKASELMEKTGGTSDPSTLFNTGVTFWNQGKMQEAKAPLTEYLKLAPTGPNAASAKGILANIK